MSWQSCYVSILESFPDQKSSLHSLLQFMENQANQFIFREALEISSLASNFLPVTSSSIIVNNSTVCRPEEVFTSLVFLE